MHTFAPIRTIHGRNSEAIGLIIFGNVIFISFLGNWPDSAWQCDGLGAITGYAQRPKVSFHRKYCLLKNEKKIHWRIFMTILCPKYPKRFTAAFAGVDHLMMACLNRTTTRPTTTF